MKSHKDVLKAMLKHCEITGINFLELDNTIIGQLSYDVEGLGGFMNPVNIIASLPEGTSKFPTLKTGITVGVLAKLGSKYRELYLSQN
jgi:hypothetical protein